MRHRPYKFITLLLALLLAASSWAPMPARAEAQMRCAGSSPQSAPCARAELPAAGLTEKQVYGRLMACCRSMQGGCAAMRDCPLRQHAAGRAMTHRAALSARRCLVSVRTASSVPMTPAVRRTLRLLTASPALGPPVTAPAAVSTFRTVRLAFWTYDPALSPHAAPTLHGLRAPPTV